MLADLLVYQWYSLRVVVRQIRNLHVGAHEGSYPAWWKEIRAEVYGWKAQKSVVSVKSRNISVPVSNAGQSVSFVLSDDGKGVEATAQ